MADLSPLYAPRFAATQSVEEISTRLKLDDELVNAQRPCSWVAWHLPSYDTDRGSAIAAHLAPYPGLGHDLKKTLYENVLNRIRRYLENGMTTKTQDEASQDMKEAEKSLVQEEFATALEVVVHLRDTAVVTRNTTVEALIPLLQARAGPSPQTPASSHPRIPTIPKPPPIPRKRLRYICRLVVMNPYPSHPSMCKPCGAFNHSSSLISTPPKLALPQTFTALVTGARVNLGYHTALRLLRCGARVIATTRYPQDAIARYVEEADSFRWEDGLKVVGADFRCAKDAHDLVHETKQCLQKWMNGGKAKLTALINNAAQTLTDSVKTEERATRREEDLAKCITHQGFLIEGSYKARVRGRPLPLGLENATTKGAVSVCCLEDQGNTETADNTNVPHADMHEVEPYTKSSWVQGISEIP